MKIKKTLLFLGLLSTAFIFTSCNSKTDNSNNSNQNNSSDQGGTEPDPIDPPGPVDPPAPDEEYVTVSYYVGNATNRELVGTQQVVKDRTLLDQLVAPVRNGYEFIQFHLVSSDSSYFIDPAFVVTKDFNVYTEYKMIDYNSIHRHVNKESDLGGEAYFNSGTAAQKANFYQGGYVTDKFDDFARYVDTAAYVKVANADQFIEALENARNEYTSNYVLNTSTTLTSEEESALATLLSARSQLVAGGNTTLTAISGNYTEEQLVQDLNELNDNRNNQTSTWKNENPFRVSLEKYANRYMDTSIKQTLINPQTVHVIEITNDIDLGYKKLSAASKAKSFVNNFCKDKQSSIDNDTATFSVTSMLKEYGISEIEISGCNNLLIYSKNGAKLTHGGFKVTSCDRVALRNLEMDEMWQWEDSPNATPNFVVGDMDVFGWAYFKVSFCGYIWFDHCTFGKAYDGVIDVSNPYFYSYGTASRAPYGKPEQYTEDDSSGVHISNCYFKSGSDDPDGYLYKMMEEIEADYQRSITEDNYACKYLYYKTLRDNFNLSFEEILYGIAIPQKKAFLLGDSSESKKAETYHYNQHLKVSLANNIIVDIEDRLPNVRGGIAYMYNTLVDNSRYYEYRNILMSKGAQGISSYGGGNYKLALVSQGIVGGYGGSICAQNCMFIGISTLVKNNNSGKDDITTDQMRAGYSVVNSIWYNNIESSDSSRIINTIVDANQIQSTVGQTSPMTVADFNWHNATNTAPFTIDAYDVTNLATLLGEDYFVGVNPYFGDYYLYCDDSAI